MMRARGSAIVAALLVVAIVAVVGGRILMIQGLSVSQALARDDYDTTREIATAALHWARAILYDDSRRSSIDHLGEAWAQSMPPTVVGDATLNGRIEDAQGRFNLNSLAPYGKLDQGALKTFGRLLTILDLPADLAETAADWIDDDDQLISQNSAESSYYLALQPGYRPSGLPFGSIEELLRVRGYTPSIVEKLRPFVIALPSPASVNVNTASPELLSALIPGLSLGDARRIADERLRSPYRTTTEFLNRVPAGLVQALPSLAVQSEYFLVSGLVRQAATSYQITALLQRQSARWPRVVWQMTQ